MTAQTLNLRRQHSLGGFRTKGGLKKVPTWTKYVGFEATSGGMNSRINNFKRQIIPNIGCQIAERPVVEFSRKHTLAWEDAD